MRILFLSLLLAVGGCTANGYCKGEFAYQKAASVPAIKGADGLKLPDSSSALKVPPPPAKSVGYAETVKDKDGDDVIACLDAPPAMPPPAPPKGADLPAPLPKSDVAPAPAPVTPGEKPKN
jgi:hypothetical protein